jgi:ketosteroid isomerase-like protein
MSAMRRRLPIALLPLLLLFLAGCSCATTAGGSGQLPGVNALIDDWHKAAADADESRYFGLMTGDSVFLGTDATERWDHDAFRAFAHPYFAKGKAWTFVPRNRHILFAPGGEVAWFDELLDSASYGECRGSGVVRKDGGRWKIAHYNLSIPIPNALAKTIVEEIKSPQTPR